MELSESAVTGLAQLIAAGFILYVAIRTVEMMMRIYALKKKYEAQSKSLEERVKDA